MRGFTLVELMLAITLFALLMGAYYVAFTNVLILEEHARSERSFGAVGPAILDVIEDDLSSLYTHPKQPDAFPLRGEESDLSGEPADRIAFVACRGSLHQEEIAGVHVRSPINEVGYRLAHGPDGPGPTRRLFRREAYYVDSVPLAGGDFYEVYGEVVGFDLAYAGYQVEEEARTSQDELGEHRLSRFESWDSEQRGALPAAVLIELTIEPPRLRAAPDEGAAGERPRRTFVRVVPLIHAQDVPPPQGEAPTIAEQNPGR